MATMASKENPIRRIFDAKPMERLVEGATEKLGRCVLAKSERSANLDLQKMFLIVAEQVCTFRWPPFS